QHHLILTIVCGRFSLLRVGPAALVTPCQEEGITGVCWDLGPGTAGGERGKTCAEKERQIPCHWSFPLENTYGPERCPWDRSPTPSLAFSQAPEIDFHNPP